MIKEEFEGKGVLKNFFFKKLYEQDNVYMFEVTNNTFVNYEVLRDGKNYNKVCKEQGIEVAEVGDGKNIKDNGYKVRKRRTVIKPSDGTNRNRHCVNWRG